MDEQTFRSRTIPPPPCARTSLYFTLAWAFLCGAFCTGAAIGAMSQINLAAIAVVLIVAGVCAGVVAGRVKGLLRRGALHGSA